MKLEIEGKFVHNSRRRDSRSAEEVRLAEERFDSIDFDLEQDIMTQVNESRKKKKKKCATIPLFDRYRLLPTCTFETRCNGETGNGGGSMV